MDLSKIYDFLTPQGLKDVISNLKNRVGQLIDENEDLFQENLELKKRTQALDDENRLLKGEKAVPKFKEPKDSSAPKDPADKEKKKDRAPRRQKIDLEIDETRCLKVDPVTLPPGAIHKGYRRISIQEIFFQRNNLCLELERFFDPATGKIIEAPIPAEYKGHEFGPTVRSFIVNQYFASDSTHHKIRKLLASINIDISVSQINNILLNSSLTFRGELATLRVKSLEKNGWQQIDDTSWKLHKESSVYTIVTGNEFFTQFVTAPSKSRRWAIYALSGEATPKYLLNDVAIDYAVAERSSLKLRLLLTELRSDRVYDSDELKAFFEQESLKELSPLIRSDIEVGMYVGAMRAGHLGVCGNALMSDDAGQFNNLYADHALCWVHELRHYRLIEASQEENKQRLGDFMARAWEFYRDIKELRMRPSPEVFEWISKGFRELFETGTTGFKELDRQRKLTAAKIEKLLAPVWNTKLPMHNNGAELDVRGKVIKRRISYFNKSWRGAEAWDTYLGLKESCRKLGVNFYQKVLAEFECRPGLPLYELLPTT